MGKLNFLRRFISNFVELVKHITTMIRKGNEVKLIPQAQDSFGQIKKDLTEAPVLIDHDYSKEFLIFSFSSYDTLATIFLKKIQRG